MKFKSKIHICKTSNVKIFLFEKKEKNQVIKYGHLEKLLWGALCFQKEGTLKNFFTTFRNHFSFH